MPTRPRLEHHPHLHALLKKDPTANQQFNQYITALANGTGAGEEPVSNITKVQTQLAEYIEKYQTQLKITSKTRRLLKLLGDAVEPQLNFKPYTQDISERASYEFKLDAGQIRLLMTMYWNLVAQEAEDKLAGRMDENPLTEEEQEDP